MGSTPKLRFVLAFLISGVFPVFYAVGGFALRSTSERHSFPYLPFIFFLMSVLNGSLTPPRGKPAQMNAADIAGCTAG